MAAMLVASAMPALAFHAGGGGVSKGKANPPAEQSDRACFTGYFHTPANQPPFCVFGPPGEEEPPPGGEEPPPPPPPPGG
jgi:hypothetical protein